jgi:hypothetical protein
MLKILTAATVNNIVFGAKHKVLEVALFRNDMVPLLQHENSMFLKTTGTCLSKYTASHPRKLKLK